MSESSNIVSSIYRSGQLYDLLMPLGAPIIHYWDTLAQRTGEPVLEIMCGTGAISIPLAQRGHQVTGLDLSEPMLAEARRKSAAAGVDVTWVQGDVRDFDLGRQFKLIFLPSNSICHLLTREDLEACLAGVMRHLHPEGRFAVSVFVPSLSLLLKTVEEESDFTEWIDPDSGEEMAIRSRAWYEASTQIRHHALYRRTREGAMLPDGELIMRMYFPQELDALFWYNGLAIEEKYGDLDRRPFAADSPLQLYVLKRR